MVKDEFTRVAENGFYSNAYAQLLQQQKLMGSRCKGCNTLYLPPRPICPKCHSYEMELTKINGKGKLVAYTVIAAPPPLMMEESFDREHPYCCGIVELEEGIRITARISGVDVTHPEKISIGTPVAVEYQVRVRGEEKMTYLAFRAML